MKPRTGAWALSEPLHPFNPAHAGVIMQSDQLAALQPGVRRTLAAELGTQPLSERFCPVERMDGTATLFACASDVGSDQADALIERLRTGGWRMSTPARYVLPSALLRVLARDTGVLAEPAPRDVHTPTALAAIFQDLVAWGVRHGASDLHLNVHREAPQSEVRYTIGGRYVAPDQFSTLPTALLMEVLAVAWMDIRGGNGAVFDPLTEQQGSLVRQVGGRSYRLRWASLAAERGASVCLRILARDADPHAPDLAALGYREDQLACFDRVMRSEGGALVFAGMVGSGKSTTLATLIRRLPEHRKVITLEEPVEYRIERAVQNTIVRGGDERARAAYAAKLRALKRSAMSDVLLGEVRDRDSGLAFMDLVGSGVNLYTTVHAPSARSIVRRLASPFVGVSAEFLRTPGALKLLVYQALLPCLCPGCALPATAAELARQDTARRPVRTWRVWLEAIAHTMPVAPDALRLRNPLGCAQCQAPQLSALAGYRGRTVAAELLEPGLVSVEDLEHEPAVPDLQHSAFAHAVQKMAAGMLDPRDVEARFLAFETWQMRTQQTGAAAFAEVA